MACEISLRNLRRKPALGKVMLGGGGEGVLIIFLGGGVSPVPENPYPISDQNIRFSVP